MVQLIELTALTTYGCVSGLITSIILIPLYVSSEKESDIDLIRRAKKEDTTAFDDLVVRYQQQIYYSIIRIVLNKEDANDVVQDTFTKAYSNLERFDERYRFYAWIHRIAVNTALNLVQRKKNLEDYGKHRDEDDQYNPPDTKNTEHIYEHKEFQEHVQNALDQLSPDMRSVFVLRVYDELSYKEIANVMDISLGTVMSRLNRARNSLKKYLETSKVIHKS